MLTIGWTLLILGLVIILLGICLWKKQKINWVSTHSHVKHGDVEAFTRMVGQSTIGIGFSVFCLGLFSVIGWIQMGTAVFAVLFILSFAVYCKAQRKYNS